MSSAMTPWHQRSYRRILVDMHIPDWDEDFLRTYDPQQIAHEVQASGAEAAMIYFQSHIGLCNWETVSGKQHALLQGKDIMARMLSALREHEIPVCAYYSVNFNNWAFLEHEDWRIQPLTRGTMGILPGRRYGLCCANNPAYRSFVHAQLREMITAHDVDAVFLDMMWWAGVCGCPSCADRYRAEQGEDIPDTVDWLNPGWCRFQGARERWMTEFIIELRDLVRRMRPGLEVYHNFALGLADWTRAVSFDSARGHDFLGGDFYGGRAEQLVISRLMLNLSEQRPVEFMTTVAANLIEHVGLKSEESLALQTYAAVASSSAFLMIAALDPGGRLNPSVTTSIRSAYDRFSVHESFLGGEAVEDVAVYCSDISKMTFADNGVPLADITASSSPSYPHFHALCGACLALQRSHLTFGVVTRKQLSSLKDYPVIVLPNLLRMTQEEVRAFRDYVRAGGRLYASRWTSMTEASGKRHEDFMLADVFGCTFLQEEEGRVVYLKPAERISIDALAPQEHLSHWRARDQVTGASRVELRNGTPLAYLSLPYGYPSEGTVGGRDWASIHSSPPWEDRSNPTVIENSYGGGSAVYSAADIEASTDPKAAALFISIIRHLLPDEPRVTSDAHPAIWTAAFDQASLRRTTLSFLNYQSDLPVLSVGQVPFTLRPPPGERFARVVIAPDEVPLDVEIYADGSVSGVVQDLRLFALLLVYWE